MTTYTDEQRATILDDWREQYPDYSPEAYAPIANVTGQTLRRWKLHADSARPGNHAATKKIIDVTARRGAELLAAMYEDAWRRYPDMTDHQLIGAIKVLSEQVMSLHYGPAKAGETLIDARNQSLLMGADPEALKQLRDALAPEPPPAARDASSAASDES
jgi:hypothetical protein